MFQLIVAVISIALVAALAIASIYYGGAAFSNSSLRANVTTLVNGGQQISGAVTLYKTDFGGSNPRVTAAQGENAAVNDLTPNYLASMPGVAPFVTGGWSLVSGAAVAQLETGADKEAICAEVNRQATGDAVTTAGTGQFFCATSAGAPAPVATATHFAFKL